jgi:peptide/nickel transport system substrate-binding protein
MKRARAFLACVLALATLEGCARRKAPGRPVRIAVHSDPIALDPHLQNELLTLGVLSNFYDGLTALDSDLRLRPNLVTTWENPDDRTWRFHLRPEVRFSDGRRLTAEDVVFSIDRARTRPQNQLGSYLVEVASISAKDPHTVDIVTKRPFGALPNKLAFVYIVPKDAPDEITSPVGTGPYRLAAYEKGKRMLLEPVANPWRARAAGPVEFRFVASAATRLAMLQNGDVDIAQDLDTTEINGGCCRVISRPSTLVEYLGLSVHDPVLSDHRVREAIHLALDRARLVATTAHGQGLAASQMVGPGIFGYEPAIPVPGRDLERARRLLAEAGHPTGLDLTMEQRRGREGDEIARELGEAGIRVKVVTRDWTEMYDRLRRREVAFYHGGLGAPTADASDIFDSAVHTRGDGYGGTNFTYYSNAEIDRLVAESGASMQPDRRRGLLQNCMRLLMQDLTLLPLYVPYDAYGIRNDVDFEPRPDRFLPGIDIRRNP